MTVTVTPTPKPKPAPITQPPARQVELELDDETRRLINECKAARLAILGAESRP